ncbi:GAF domain-containing protein [Streptomyces sp. NPDC017979]|uniref:GAF domain-containing protein n=1 Tax=unclassified Streptomyces TaxID=2593676 RepID=UPI0037AFEEDD
MRYDPTNNLLLTPVDREALERGKRLRTLGFWDRADPVFDDFAKRLADAFEAPYSLVNFIDENRQFFAGLHTPTGAHSGRDLGATAAAAASAGAADRIMGRDRGYCPHVVVRRKALVLEDVCDYPRFAGNPVVDEIGVRSYLGAPLIDRTGTALGTICVCDTEPRAWGRAGLESIKAMAGELIEEIHRREDGFL